LTEQTKLRTEFSFVLPRGYVDWEGQVHREGTMRLATARDELFAQMDARVQRAPGYLTVALLEKTITRLGSVPMPLGASVIENLFASDMAFLQDLYRRINQEGHTEAAVTCPACNHEFSVDISGAGLGE